MSRRWRRPPPPPGQEALVARVRSLEPSAWRLLFDQAYPVLSTYAMLRLGNAGDAGAAIRDGMLRAVRVLPSSTTGGDALRAELLGFVAEQIRVMSGLRLIPDPVAAAALPDEGRRFRTAFWALPACEQDLLALLVAGVTLGQAAAAIRWSPAVAARSVASACSLLGPGVPLAQVLEQLRVSFPSRPWEPKLEDQQALRAAVVAARAQRRRSRRLGAVATAACAALIVVASVMGDVLPRSVQVAAHSVGLPVRSPLVADVERDVAALTEALRLSDPPRVDAATRALTASFDALAPPDLRSLRDLHPDVELELLRARQFLDAQQAAADGPYPAR